MQPTPPNGCPQLLQLVVPDGVDGPECIDVEMQVTSGPCTAGTGDDYYLVQAGGVTYYGRTGQPWHVATAAKAKRPAVLARSVGCSG